MSRRDLSALAHALLTCLMLGPILAVQSPVAAAGRTVWDGVYDAAQAARGQEMYLQRCSSCHGDFLDGDGASGRVVGLSAATFADNWDAASLNDLFVKIAKTMPLDAPGTLRSPATLDLVAFLLQFNGFPAGRTPLAETSDLALVEIVGRDGPRPLRVGSGVRTVGCLTPAPGGNWTLTHASPPVRTRNPAASVGADLDRARGVPLGPTTIRLTNAHLEPQHGPGAKVEVKGALSVIGAEDGITVMSLQAVGVCE